MPVASPRRVSAGRTARASIEVWVLTVLAHSMAGGGLPSLPWLVGVAGLAAISTAWVLRRSVRPAVMLPALVLCQLGLHAVFAGLSPAGPEPVGQLPVHEHAAAAPWWIAELSPRMLLAHLLCAVLTGVIWWLRRWVAHVVLTLARSMTVPARPPWVLGRARASLGPAFVWLVADPGRAPPLVLAPA